MPNKKQSLKEYMNEFAKVEAKRIYEAQESFPVWLATQDKSAWCRHTIEDWRRIWSPEK